MNPVYLAGQGLACALGLSVNACVAGLREGTGNTVLQVLPGEFGGVVPYRAIPGVAGDWQQRATELIGRVCLEAGAEHARDGALFVATSSFDIGAVEQQAAPLGFQEFVNRLTLWLNWAGPVYVVSTACTSSLNALLAAQSLLRSGVVNDALVLGVELDNRLTLGGFAAMQLLSPDRSRPFGQDRNGLVLGEAVAAIRLSTHQRAPWQLRGGANVVDGQQPTSASATAIQTMYQNALADSGLTAADIDLIKVQAAGSPGNDAIEAQGLRDSFTVLPPLLSLKPALGHTMGACGAAEIALLMACLEQGLWPSCPDPVDASLGVQLASQAPACVRRLMATILGFGGGHASVVLERA
jgi:3-oxoacyl-[acyl-carrier-protein] synthase-1